MKCRPVTRWAAAALALALPLSLTACAEDSSSGSNNGGGVGVEYGADKAAYAEALADMEPVEFVIQSTAPKGSATGRRFEDYAAAVTDWSDRKITFEFIYSNGAAAATEVHTAIDDGRIDIGSVMPSLLPDEFPASDAYQRMSHLGSQLPVKNVLQWHGIMFDLSTTTAAVDEEYEDHGMKLLLPAFGAGAYMPYCKKPTATGADLDNRGIASQSRDQNSQTKALGMKPASIAYTEMYESLERGVVDCAMSTVTGAALGGYIPSAAHVAYDPEVGFNAPGGSIAINLDKWNDLPLAAQQVMIDRLDALMTANFEGAWANTADAVGQVADAGGAYTEFDAAASQALAGANAEIEASVASSEALGDGDGFVAAAKAAEQKWSAAVDGLGIEGVDSDYAEFADWYDRGTPDLQPYFDLLWKDVVSKRRPS